MMIYPQTRHLFTSQHTLPATMLASTRMLWVAPITPSQLPKKRGKISRAWIGETHILLYIVRVVHSVLISQGSGYVPLTRGP